MNHRNYLLFRFQSLNINKALIFKSFSVKIIWRIPGELEFLQWNKILPNWRDCYLPISLSLSLFFFLSLRQCFSHSLFLKIKRWKKWVSCDSITTFFGLPSCFKSIKKIEEKNIAQKIVWSVNWICATFLLLDKNRKEISLKHEMKIFHFVALSIPLQLHSFPFTYWCPSQLLPDCKIP